MTCLQLPSRLHCHICHQVWNTSKAGKFHGTSRQLQMDRWAEVSKWKVQSPIHDITGVAKAWVIRLCSGTRQSSTDISYVALWVLHVVKPLNASNCYRDELYSSLFGQRKLGKSHGDSNSAAEDRCKWKSDVVDMAVTFSKYRNTSLYVCDT